METPFSSFTDYLSTEKVLTMKIRVLALPLSYGSLGKLFSTFPPVFSFLHLYTLL